MYILLIHIPGFLNIHLLCTKHFLYVCKNFAGWHIKNLNIDEYYSCDFTQYLVSNEYALIKKIHRVHLITCLTYISESVIYNILILK